MEDRKNKKKAKGRPKKSETVSNNSTKDKAHKDDSSSDDEEDSSDEEDAKLSRSKNRASKAKIPEVKKSTKDSENLAVPEVKVGRKAVGRTIGGVQDAKTPEIASQIEPDKNVANDKSSAKNTNKTISKQKDSNIVTKKVESKEAELTKPSNKPPKRKASKEVFEFEDDFEEEVMPIPKKRTSLNTSNDSEKMAKDLSAGVKDKVAKDSDKDKDEIKDPVPVAPTKTVNAPKSSKRGRGRSRKWKWNDYCGLM